MAGLVPAIAVFWPCPTATSPLWGEVAVGHGRAKHARTSNLEP